MIAYTRYGDFSIHYEKGVALISNHMHRDDTPVKPEFNPYQRYLLKRCLNGLKVFSERQLYYLSKAKKERIERVHEHSIRELNLYCQEMLINLTNGLIVRFANCTHEYSIPRAFLECDYVDPDYTLELTPYELGITHKMIAIRLVERKCLPINYFRLTDPRIEPIDTL